MRYLGRKFKNADEIKAYNKQGNINYYKTLCETFNKNPSLELSIIMSDLMRQLVEVFGMSYDEVEAIENSVYKPPKGEQRSLPLPPI